MAMSLMKAIVQKLIYCYYKYGVTGLLMIPDNLLVNIDDNFDMKFKHFLTAVQLDVSAIKQKSQNVTYVSGIDSKYFINSSTAYPP